MLSLALLRRLVALQLLVATPAVFAARVSLDAPWKLNAGDHIEAEHCDCCTTSHDHTLCALLFNTHWSSAAATARLLFSAPPTKPLPAGAAHRQDAGPLDLEVARSPPEPPGRESR